MKKQIISLGLVLTACFAFGQKWIPVGSGVSGNNSYDATYNGVNALDSAKGLLYVGGSFDTAGGTQVHNIASWNGSSWSALGGGISGSVSAIIEFNGNIIVGGNFTAAGGIPANNIAMWNGTSWSALGAGITGGVYQYTVKALAVYNGNLIAAGSFTTAGGIAANSIAQWNGTSWDSLGAGVNSQVNSLAVYNNTLYAGGYFTSAGTDSVNQLASWNGTAWDSIPTWKYSTKPYGVSVLAIYNNHLCVSVDGGISEWNGTKVDTGMSYNGGQGIGAMFPYQGHFIVGGAGVQRVILSYGSNGWDSLGDGILSCGVACATMGGTMEPIEVYTIASYDGHLFAGGSGFAVDSYPNPGWDLGEYTGIVGIDEIKETKTITVYPNPSNGVFQLKITNYELGMKNMVEVYNMLGEKVFYQYPILTTQYSIDLSSQPTGVYLYRIINIDGSLVSSGKLIKE